MKWLQRIIVIARDEEAANFHSSGMDRLYNRETASAGGRLTVRRLGEIDVKSVIVWPPDNARLPAATHMVRGFAWTGSGIVRSVSLSWDGGQTWIAAQFETKPSRFAWSRWRCSWRADPGDHVLMARASDEAGREQPLKRDPSRRDGYAWNFCAPVHCSVR